MRHEQIRAIASWWEGTPRFDCIFASGDPALSGFRGLLVGRVRLLFSFFHQGHKHSCALVEWFSAHGDSPDGDTGLWVVTPDFTPGGLRERGVIALDSIIRAAHLIPIYGPDFLPLNFNPRDIDVLDAFAAYFVNKFADHHAHTLAV